MPYTGWTLCVPQTKTLFNRDFVWRHEHTLMCNDSFVPYARPVEPNEIHHQLHACCCVVDLRWIHSFIICFLCHGPCTRTDPSRKLPIGQRVENVTPLRTVSWQETAAHGKMCDSFRRKQNHGFSGNFFLVQIRISLAQMVSFPAFHRCGPGLNPTPGRSLACGLGFQSLPNCVGFPPT